VYLAYQRPDLAKDVLLAGLPYLPDNPGYLQSTLGFLLEFQEDTQLLEIATRLLAAPANPATRPLVATFAATAAYHRGNYDEAESLIERHGLGLSPEGAMLQARIAWERGFPELALLRLKEHLARHPGHDAARALLAGYYRSLDRISDWESALVERVAGDPLAPAPRVAYLQLHQRRGDQARLERETTAFLRQFGDDPAALLLLGDFAATNGQPALARRVQLALAGRPENAGAAALMVAEAHLVAGDYQTALDLIAGYTKEYPEWSGQFAPVCNGLQAVALCGLGRSDEARLSLDHLLAQKNLRAENLVAVAGRLVERGARELALSALSRAVEADPLNQAALASLIRLELETGNLAHLPAHLERFLNTRQPAREILARASAELGSDRHLLLAAQKPLLASLRAALGPPRP
jgi:predicted Zn-dependent protease